MHAHILIFTLIVHFIINAKARRLHLCYEVYVVKLGKMSGVVNQLLENILSEAGGLGRFQFLIISVINLGKFPITWSVIMMTYGGATPDWWCYDYRKNSSILKENNNNVNETMGASIFKMCNVNGSEFCSSVHFDPDMKTVISEVT
jgi:hypothetical protein